jgi:hypothetical protein
MKVFFSYRATTSAAGSYKLATKTVDTLNLDGFGTIFAERERERERESSQVYI